MTTPSESVEIYCVKCKAKTAGQSRLIVFGITSDAKY